MKMPLLLCLLLAAPLAAKETTTIAAAEAGKHAGEYVRVVGRVTGVHITAKGDAFVQFDRPYPQEDFTAVVFGGDRSKFGDLEKLKGRNVAVTGAVRIYHEKPEIILRRREQLEEKTE